MGNDLRCDNVESAQIYADSGGRPLRLGLDGFIRSMRFERAIPTAGATALSSAWIWRRLDNEFCPQNRPLCSLRQVTAT